MKNSNYNWLTLLTVIIITASCNKNVMVYAKYGKMNLALDEVNSYPVSNTDINAFDTCCYTAADNLFLNRSVINTKENYRIFISLSEVMLQSDFEQLQNADATILNRGTRSELVSKVKVNAYMLERNSKKFVRYTYIETRSGLLIIYDFVSTDQKRLDDIYNNISSYLDDKIKL